MNNSPNHFNGTIREFRTEDLASVGQILYEWLHDDRTGEPRTEDIMNTLAAVKTSIVDNKAVRYFVAETLEGKVIGMLGLSGTGIDGALVDSSDNAAELVSAYVASDQQGGGVGTALADTAEQVAMRMGYTKLIIVSGSRNRDSGYAFWNKRYGEPMLYQADFFGKGQERVVWSKTLL